MSDDADDSQDKLNRRLFIDKTLKALAAVGTFQMLPQDVQAQIRLDNFGLVHKHGFSILQGPTSKETTQLSIDVPKDLKVVYRLVDMQGRGEVGSSLLESYGREHSSWRVDQIVYTGLTCPGFYTFQVLDEKGKVLDERTLGTLDLDRKDVRVGVTSCLLDFSPDKGPMWKAALATGPDIMFLIGDNVYGDYQGIFYGPALLWRRYIETRRRVPFYHIKHLIPTVAIWDDHDMGRNNCDGNYRHKVDSLRTLQAFFPMKEIQGVYFRGPGASSCLKAFGHNFIFADNKYFLETVENKKSVYWGEQQTNWIFATLQDAAKCPTWFLQGSQFFGKCYPIGQSFETKHKEELSQVGQAIGQLSAPALFWSGDVHFTEVMKLEKEFVGYETYEITTSSLHSYYSLLNPENPRRQEIVLRHNFTFADLCPTEHGNVCKVSCIDSGLNVKFALNLDVG